MLNDNLFLNICLPYILKQQNNGTYVVLNRRYKPLGFHTNEFVDYPEYPIQHLICLPKEVSDQLIPGKGDNSGSFYLYTDETSPLNNAKNWISYSDKLALLKEQKIKT